MFKKINGRRGGEKLFSIWWFFILAIIGIGIVGGVLTYYSVDVNVKEVEAQILNQNLYDCLVEGGFINQEIIFSFDFLKKCNLKKELFGEGSKFYFKVQFFNEDGALLKEIIEGQSSLYGDCDVQDWGLKSLSENYPKCFYLIDRDILYYENGIKKGFINIFTVSNNQGQNVKK
jgi:hypothetical protein